MAATAMNHKALIRIMAKAVAHSS